jgi:hypothetical protein
MVKSFMVNAPRGGAAKSGSFPRTALAKVSLSARIA